MIFSRCWPSAKSSFWLTDRLLRSQPEARWAQYAWRPFVTCDSSGCIELIEQKRPLWWVIHDHYGTPSLPHKWATVEHLELIPTDDLTFWVYNCQAWNFDFGQHIFWTSKVTFVRTCVQIKPYGLLVLKTTRFCLANSAPASQTPQPSLEAWTTLSLAVNNKQRINTMEPCRIQTVVKHLQCRSYNMCESRVISSTSWRDQRYQLVDVW